jgi:hypothetical protein
MATFYFRLSAPVKIQLSQAFSTEIVGEETWYNCRHGDQRHSFPIV